jgi:uncharacterized protein (DUF952 family)
VLAFDAPSHTYRDALGVVPGVTEVLRPLVDFSRIPPAVLAAKADLGTRVHLACELDDHDDLDEASVQDDVAPYLAAYRRFRLDSWAEVLASEQQVYSAAHRYAGTLDRVLLLDGARVLVDLKTCITTPSSAGPQTAAYLHALADRAVTRRAALRLRPDGTYRLDPLTDPNDFSTFLGCLAVHRHLEKHA